MSARSKTTICGRVTKFSKRGCKTPIGTSIRSQGGFFPAAPSVPSYAGYQEPIPTSYAPEKMKSAVPRLKKDDTKSYLVFTKKFCMNLIFHNLGHVTNEQYMKAMLPTLQDQVYGVAKDHPWALAVCNSNAVMVLYNEAIQDDAASIVLEETKTDEYWELGLAYKCFQALQCRYLYQCITTDWELGNKRAT